MQTCSLFNKPNASSAAHKKAKEVDAPRPAFFTSYKYGKSDGRHWRPYWIIVLSALLGGEASASAFQILEQSPAQLGHAFAGTASNTSDASTVFFNPSAMTSLDGRAVSVGLNVILVQAEFNDLGSTTGGMGGTTEEPGFVPNLYLVQPFNTDWSFGFGINAPFGLASSFDDDWIGRYLATDSELEVINVSGSAAYRFNDQFSVGVGVNYQDAQVVLDSQVDSTFGLNPRPATDSSASIRGDDTAVVFDLSAHWTPTEQTAVGISWRQGAKFALSGEAAFDLNEQCQPSVGLPTGVPPAPTTGTLCSQLLGALGGNARADVELPDTLTLSASQQLSDAWSLHGDVAWTGWSSVDVVEITNTGNDRTIDELDLQYANTMRYALGLTYATRGPWTWRFGTAFDEAPQTDPQYVTPRIPDQDRVWLSAGFNYRLSRLLTVDVGYAHLFVDDAVIDDTNPDTGHRVYGQFESDADIIGIQANWYW